MIIFAGISGLLDDIPVDKVNSFEGEFLKFVDSMYPQIGGMIKETKDLSVDLEEALKKAILEYKNIFRRS